MTAWCTILYFFFKFQGLEGKLCLLQKKNKKTNKRQLCKTLASTWSPKVIEHPRSLLICGSACLMIYARNIFMPFDWNKRISRMPLSPPFFHHCKGKSMTYLEFFFSGFLLFLKRSHRKLFYFFFFFTQPVFERTHLPLPFLRLVSEARYPN